MRQRARKVKAELGECEFGGQSLSSGIKQYHPNTYLQARAATSNPRGSCEPAVQESTSDMCARHAKIRCEKKCQCIPLGATRVRRTTRRRQTKSTRATSGRQKTRCVGTKTRRKKSTRIREKRVDGASMRAERTCSKLCAATVERNWSGRCAEQVRPLYLDGHVYQKGRYCRRLRSAGIARRSHD